MSNAASQPSEKVGIVATIDPQTVVNSEVFSDVVDMRLWHEVMFILCLGNMSSETIDFAVYTCDSDGSNATELKDIVQLSASASANDNKQAVINVKSMDLASANKRYVKAGVVTGGASGGPACVIGLGMVPRYTPASDYDLSTVAEIVSE